MCVLIAATRYSYTIQSPLDNGATVEVDVRREQFYAKAMANGQRIVAKAKVLYKWTDGANAAEDVPGAWGKAKLFVGWDEPKAQPKA